MKKLKVFFTVLFFVICSWNVFAAYSQYGVPDSSEIRKNLIETWFEAPLSEVRMNRPEIRTNGAGQKFQIRHEETNDIFAIIVAPLRKMTIDVISDKGKSTIVQDAYPADAPGGWVLTKDKKTGKALQVRYYFAADSEVFVQLIPDGKAAYADFLIYNCYVSKGSPTGIKFEYFYTASFDSLVEVTKETLPWKYMKIYPSDYSYSKQMIGVIRSKLPDFLYTDDVMYDEKGTCVYISTGKPFKIPEEDRDKTLVSGLGFLKWIGDGIVEPLTGGRLKREPLIESTIKYKDIGFQGILSESYAISLSCDWIRNLASALVSVRNNRSYMYDESGADVTIEPFSAERTEKGLIDANNFIKNTGYSVKVLKSLLYVLASEEPDSFYFGAVRQIDRKVPEVKVFNESAVFFPYFDEDRHFKCVAFKDGKEILFEDFYNLYSDDYIFLTRAKCTDNFFPSVE